jgi:signal transduction histidine kinase
VGSDAHRASHHQPARERIQVWRRTRDSAQLVIRDHGIGIAEDDQNRIFSRYERAASSRSYGGLGLGLYIARQIVDAHGGTIRVESTLGVGSTFTVSLPLLQGRP